MQKLLPSLLLILLSLQSCLCLSTTQQQNISPEQDKQIQRLSDFFIQLINKYDNTGNGLIKRSIYPLFLKDVFIKGSFGNTDHLYQHEDLLLNATTQFTGTKDDKLDSVSVQEFYDDIISRFTLFLMERQEYQIIISTLFQDLELNTKKNGKPQPQAQQADKQTQQPAAQTQQL